MDFVEAKSRYNELSSRQKIEFLIRFSHALTIVGRECYDLDSNGVDHPKSLRYINEMQHRIMGAAMGIRSKKSEDTPRDWIVELMLTHENALLKARSSEAFEQALAFVTSS